MPTPVGSLRSDAGGSLNSISSLTSTAGNHVFLLSTKCSSSITVTSVTSTHATWIKVAGPFSIPSSSARVELWMGVTNAAATATVSLAYSGSPGYVQLDAQEFSGGPGTWTKDNDGFSGNSSSSVLTYPPLTPAGSARIYFGRGSGTNFVSQSAGSTSGFTYVTTAAGEQIIYNADVDAPTSPTAPLGTPEPSCAIGVLVYLASGGGTPAIPHIPQPHTARRRATNF